MAGRASRPRYLNLIQIHLPVTGFASIAHRVTGVLLFLLIPLLLYLFELSLESEEGFLRVWAILTSLPARLFFVLLAWSLAHHLFAGIRYLFIDIDIGVELPTARMNAWIVLVGGALVAVAVLVIVL